jgi:hypothetical protein
MLIGSSHFSHFVTYFSQKGSWIESLIVSISFWLGLEKFLPVFAFLGICIGGHLNN